MIFILEEDDRFFGGVEGGSSELVAAELLVPLATRIRFVEKSETVFGTEDSTYGIVDTLHLHFAFLHQFLQQDAEVDALGVHRHIDSGIDGEADGVFLVLGNNFAGEEVVDVGPVCHEESVPL